MVTCLLMLVLLLGQQGEADKEYIEQMSVPLQVSRLLKEKGLDRKFKVSFQLNPFYLRGDFNGDGLTDIALFLKSRRTGFTSIAVLHFGTREVHLVGGKSMHDDYSRMNIWGVVFEDAQDRNHVHREKIYIYKTEAGGGTVEWDGKQYVWHQTPSE